MNDKLTYQQRYQAAKKAKGLCIACGCKRQHAPNRTLCQPCLDRMNINGKKRNKARNDAGLCRQCGTRPLYSKVFCLVCLESQRTAGTHGSRVKQHRLLPNQAIRALREHRQQQADIEFTDSLAAAQEMGRLLLDEVTVTTKKYRGRRLPGVEQVDTHRKLTDRERNMVSLYYGLDGFLPTTLEEISQVYGLTRKRVRQLIKPFEVVAKQIGLPKAQGVPKRLRGGANEEV